MKVVLINPNLVVQSNDPFTTGIVYMPISLAYVASMLRNSGYEPVVIDAFGERPKQCRRSGKFMIMGLTEKEVCARIAVDAKVVFIFANQLINHISIVALIKSIKKFSPELTIAILENTQAVTSYALRDVASEFFSYGADFLVTGEGELRSVEICRLLESGQRVDISTMEGVLVEKLVDARHNSEVQDSISIATNKSFIRSTPRRRRNRRKFIEDLDSLPFPAWDLFPLENYWALRFAHGPQSSAKYLPLLTSRGCPYPCKFCVVPATNDTTWRARSPKNVVDEIEHWHKTLRLSEFHLEDLNSTVDDWRTKEICREIMDRGLKISWKIVAGTKVETIKSEHTLDQMAKAGCGYISISPETGSPRVLKLIDKPFRTDYARRLIAKMNSLGIRSQACFVLGFPGEEDDDRNLTWLLAKDLTRNGLDEIALFIISPVPGSEIYSQYKGYQSLSDLNFTPVWREDYSKLRKFRLKLYGAFFWWKLRYYPIKLLAQAWRFVTRRFETKMEMVPYKALVWKSVEITGRLAGH